MTPRKGVDRPLLVIALSGKIFGAQGRLLKLYRRLAVEDGLVDPLLVVNPTLYAASREHDLAREVVDGAQARGRLIVTLNRHSVFSSLRRSSALPLLLSRRPRLALLSIGMHRFRHLFRRLGWPVVFEVTSPDIADRLDARLAQEVDALLCVSPSVATRTRAKLEALTLTRDPPPVATMTRPFVDLGAREPKPKEKLIVAASRFLRRKNVHLIAAALVEALPRLPGWRAALLGFGPEEEAIRQQLGPLLGERVFVGQVPGIGDYVERSKIFVSLIEPDNFPSQSIMEAMAAENALLLSDTGSSHRFLAGDPPGNGRLVPLEAGAVAEALVVLAADEAALADAGRISTSIVEGDWHTERYVGEYLERLDPYIRGGGRG